MNEGAASKERDRTAMEQLISEIEVGNKVFTDLTHRLEKIKNRLVDESGVNKAELQSGQDKQSQSLPGHIATIKNSIEYTRSLNARLSIVVDRLEGLI